MGGNRLFYCQIKHIIHEHLPQDWLVTLKNSVYHHDDENAVFRISLFGKQDDITDVKTETHVTTDSKKRVAISKFIKMSYTQHFKE